MATFTINFTLICLKKTTHYCDEPLTLSYSLIYILKGQPSSVFLTKIEMGVLRFYCER